MSEGIRAPCGAIDEERPIGLESFERWLATRPARAASAYRPVIVELEPGELTAFRGICERHRLAVLDAFDRQLAELAAVRLPAASAEEHGRFVDAYVAAAGGRDVCGRWVHLPWTDVVAHLLEPDAYHEVITNRNRDKITSAEQAVLRTKTIGVMGLSVGGEAAVAVAQEHLCGHIVLADLDRLDLSNLNRLNAGFDELGLSKTTIAARRIARIDPYLRVTVFDEGVTEENAPAFLNGLDLLIEECDALPLKYRIRELAKARGLNVVFAGDERGFLSVEPYAFDPGLPVFHERIAGAPPPRSEFSSARDFFRHLAEWLGGWSRLSERTRASLEQVGDALCGYPQLSSEARFAAGQVGHVARRLLLDERLRPFIGHVDLDEILPSTVGRR